MSDIVERLRDTGVSTGWEAVIRDAHEAADEIERLNRELDDVWDALAIQREDNVSFGDAFKRMTAEIERLRAALKPLACTCPAKHQEECSRSEVDCPFWNARAALADEKLND